ncbi:MAG: hypothetical protein ACO34J_04980 [Prochlorothrix sp.]
MRSHQNALDWKTQPRSASPLLRSHQNALGWKTQPLPTIGLSPKKPWVGKPNPYRRSANPAPHAGGS